MPNRRRKSFKRVSISTIRDFVRSYNFVTLNLALAKRAHRRGYSIFRFDDVWSFCVNLVFVDASCQFGFVNVPYTRSRRHSMMSLSFLFRDKLFLVDAQPFVKQRQLVLSLPTHQNSRIACRSYDADQRRTYERRLVHTDEKDERTFTSSESRSPSFRIPTRC